MMIMLSDGETYCMQQYSALFIVIAASRPVNKNISTRAVIRAKPGTEPGVQLYKLLATIKPVVTSLGL